MLGTILSLPECKKAVRRTTTLGVEIPDSLYSDTAEEFGPSLERLARAYEADPEKRRDLLQEIHFQLWRSFRSYNVRCSLRTWVYRVAHHTATSHVIRERRTLRGLVSLEQIETLPDPAPRESGMDERRFLEQLAALIQQLKPLDRQVIVCYLEDMDALSIAEITGLSPGSVAVRIHRVKRILARRFREGGMHAR